MTNTVVPCKAKDPNTCKYHGAQLRGEAALLRGDFETWMQENTNMMANRNIDEVQEFLVDQQGSEQPPTGFKQARKTFDDRYDKVIDDINHGEPANFRVGGTHKDLANERQNELREAYQRAADEATFRARIAPGDNPGDGFNYYVERSELLSALRDFSGHGTPTRARAEAYEHAIDVIGNLKAEYEDQPPLPDVLKTLDRAYWKEAQQTPVPNKPVSDFDTRFSDAYQRGLNEPFTPYGVNPYQHKLTPYQQGIVDAAQVIAAKTREETTGATETRVLTSTAGIRTIDDQISTLNAVTRDEEARRAYRDVKALLHSQLTVYRQPNKLDAYDVHKGLEKLFKSSLNNG